MTKDHKPNNKDEKSRIKACGGRVQRSVGRSGLQTGSWRVWLKDKDSPGLAMSRSIGDKDV